MPLYVKPYSSLLCVSLAYLWVFGVTVLQVLRLQSLMTWLQARTRMLFK